ncbi:uncharacterized protein STEHIDRAFT_163133 [Stereum hirsutum FP-91666 SS1]|uniref:Uncharacterized protein n=1 Tax=Stereum hirsutum (strain FP-91666) TaxID=721885 RepID=R7RZY4_STEHR|nr:uncharacterized protein STEHIDRAFT_163133 [Stereum hirsutum FP-91666 SS1]EIM79877.1 hypothetical protein STEHIDRAFT_163133 [Stereum hirsutum FP-91666 SS1]
MSSASDLRSLIEHTLGYQLIGAFIAAVTFALENGLTCLVTLVVQCFFAHRVWLVSSKETKIIPAIIAICSLVGFGGGCAYVNSLLAILNAREYLGKALNGPDNIRTISGLRFNIGSAANSTALTRFSNAAGANIELGAGSQNDQRGQEREIKFANSVPLERESSFGRV